jgi:hypothetical protein
MLVLAWVGAAKILTMTPSSPKTNKIEMEYQIQGYTDFAERRYLSSGPLYGFWSIEAILRYKGESLAARHHITVESVRYQ